MPRLNAIKNIQIPSHHCLKVRHRPHEDEEGEEFMMKFLHSFRRAKNEKSQRRTYAEAAGDSPPPKRYQQTSVATATPPPTQEGASVASSLPTNVTYSQLEAEVAETTTTTHAQDKASLAASKAEKEEEPRDNETDSETGSEDGSESATSKASGTSTKKTRVSKRTTTKPAKEAKDARKSAPLEAALSGLQKKGDKKAASETRVTASAATTAIALNIAQQHAPHLSSAGLTPGSLSTGTASLTVAVTNKPPRTTQGPLPQGASTVTMTSVNTTMLCPAAASATAEGNGYPPPGVQAATGAQEGY